MAPESDLDEGNMEFRLKNNLVGSANKNKK